MSVPKTGGRKDCFVEVEFDPENALGVFTKWCGSKNFSLSLKNDFATEKVADCDDLNAAVVTLRSPSGQDVTASMTATWSPATHAQTSAWALEQSLLKVRVVFPNAGAGEVDTYQGNVYLEGLDLANISDIDGNKISEDCSLLFDGGIVRTLKAA